MRSVVFLVVCFAYSQVFAQNRGGVVENLQSSFTISADSTFAIVAGVSAYEFIQPLRYADADAKEFYRFLTAKTGAGIPAENVKLLLNKDASRSSLLNNVYAFLAKNKDKAKRIIIYFSGHGDADAFGEQYLLAAACNPAGDVNNYAATDAVSVNELKNKLKLFLGAGIEVMLVMDACRTTKLISGSSNNLLDITANLEQVNGELLFLSCEKGQVSQEGTQWGNGRGLYSFHLLNGLWGAADKDKNGTITIDEIKRYTDSKIYDDPNNKTSQSPVFRYAHNSTHPLFPCAADAGANVLAMAGTVGGEVGYKNAIRIKASTAPDVNLTKLYSAVAAKKFLQPESDCAMYYLEQLKKSKAAADVLNNAANTIALEMLDSCMRTMNLYIGGLDKLGNYQYRLGKIFTNGKQLFEKASNLLAVINPEIIEVNKHIGLFFSGRSVLEIEDDAQRTAKLQEALQAVNEALKLKPNAAYLHHLKALVVNAMGKKEEAILSEKEAIRLAPNWIYPYNTLGGIYFSQRKYGEAIEQYNKALAIDTNSFLPYVGLGNAWKKSGKFNQALVYYNLSVQKDSLSAVSFYNRGFFYLHSNEAEKAKKDFERCLKIDPRFYDGYLGLAMYYEKKQQYNEAFKQYELAIAIDKTALKEMQSSATSFEMLGNKSQADVYREQIKVLEVKYMK